jgi:CHAT domain-containing protein
LAHTAGADPAVEHAESRDKIGSVPLAAENEALRFALERLAHRHGSEASQAAAAAAFEHGRRALDQLLLAPLSTEVGDRPLVIVPTGALHVVPWSALRSCAGRPVTVAPSARLWQRATEGSADASVEAPTDGSAHTPGQASTVLVAGPDVPAAGAEIAALRATYPDATCVTGEDARVQAVAAALDGAGLGHLVAHGRFRVDNPLFSSLRLADGPLTVYDLEALSRPPLRLVLSACDAGLTDVRAGDELRGLVAALFMLGTRTVIAPVTPVRDSGTRPLMVALHRALAAGDTPATALAKAQADPGDTADARGAAAGFVCFGAA